MKLHKPTIHRMIKSCGCFTATMWINPSHMANVFLEKSMSIWSILTGWPIGIFSSL